MKIVTVVGARPQFVKAATISRAIREFNLAAAHPVEEVLVHTGQHYDENLSQVFFDQLDVSPPKYNLGIGSLSHGAQTGRMLEAIEEVLIRERPDWVLVFGDTNSTLAGALAGRKLDLAVGHVEAGLRSRNRAMPEETNRIVTDHVSNILFCPTKAAMINLEREGLVRGRELVGDVMYDASLQFLERAKSESQVIERFDLVPKRYVLVTVHRAENTDDSARLAGILEGLSLVAAERDVIVVLHPRTRSRIQKFNLEDRAAGVTFVDPVPFFDMVRLEESAEVICTDSGGVQKEAFFYGVQCVTLRDETEWVETVESGWNTLAGCDPIKIRNAVFKQAPKTRAAANGIYGDGRAGNKILQLLIEQRS